MLTLARKEKENLVFPHKGVTIHLVFTNIKDTQAMIGIDPPSVGVVSEGMTTSAAETNAHSTSSNRILKRDEQ